MASDTTKGLIVKIGADTSDFIKELKKVDKEINTTNKQANELQKGLQLEFDEGRFLEAQRLVRQSLEDTEEKAKAIKAQLKFLEDSGAVDTDGYKRLQTELYKTENSAVLLKQKLEDINNVNTSKISTKIKDFVNNLKTSTVVALSVAKALTKITTNSAKAGGEIQDMADRLGVTAEQIQRYDYIAMQSGVDTEQLVKSMAKARDAIGTGLSGASNTATQALEKLFGDLSAIPTGTEEGFNAIIEKLSQVKDSTLQAYYANEIFGERLATNLIPLINNGAEEIEKLNKEFENLGSLTNEEVQELADFDDKINQIDKKVKNLSYQLGLVLVPVLELVYSILEPFIPLLELILDLINPIIEFISKFAGTVVNDLINIGSGATDKYFITGESSSKSNNTLRDKINSYINKDYSVPNELTTENNSYEDNSTTNITINTELTGDLNYDTKTLADSVIKEIVTRKQAGGR